MNEGYEKMLKIIFQAREDKLAELDKKDEQFMKNNKDNRKIEYYNLKKQLDKIPYTYEDIKQEILKIIENYVEAINYENSYFTEKYYLNGLKDGIKLMNETEE